MVDNTIIHSSKPIECSTPRVNPNENYGLWVIMMCKCRFINCNKYTALVGDVDNGGGYTCVWVGVYGKFLHLLPNFAANLRLL